MNYSVLESINGRSTKHNVPAHIPAVIAAIVLFLLLAGVIATDARAADTDKLVIDIDKAQLNIQFEPDFKSYHSIFGSMFLGGTYSVKDWEVKQYTPTQYHVRLKSWRDMFWSIDSEQKKIWRMKGADLTAAGSEAQLLDDITVNILHNRFTKKGVPLDVPSFGPNSLNNNRARDVQKDDTDIVQKTSISLTMTSPRLILDQQAGSVLVVAGGAVISGADAWEVRHVNKNTYHMRYKPRQQMQHDYWQLDLTSMTADYAIGDTFGFPNGKFIGISKTMYRERANGSSEQNEIPVDLTMARYSGDHPKSAWQESEKALNTAVLSKYSYDVLVVPFQVSGYAIDRVDRSLMTRYLAREIENSTKMKLPSPTLVARALGETYRTFDDYDVFQLANKLGVKQIIRGYVGHNLNEKMSVTLVVQTRNEQEYFSPATKTVKYTWRDIEISDERTPGEAFASILHDVTARLQLPKVKKDASVQQDEPPAVPAGIKGLVVNSSSSPAVRAYYLQLLGLLYPEQSAAKEQLFERSLVVLREMLPQSPSYNVLKARALFHLYRRPAAIAVLANPKSAEEKALSAVMDGNLQLLNKNMKDIKGGIPRLIAQIEHSDLLWRYSPDQALSESTDPIIKQWPGWEKILARRLSQRDGWNIQSNVEVKKELDRIFPIIGFTAADIIKSKMAIGELPIDDDDIDFSVYNHYRRMMENRPEVLSTNESSGIVDRDILDLMVAMGESNLVKKIELRRMQALYDEMLKLADRYNTVYDGYPKMAYLKAFALYRIADSKQGQAQKNLREEANQLQGKVCYWSQGQTDVTSNRSCSGNNIYDADYPRRWYWEFSRDPDDLADRKYRGPEGIEQRGNIAITRFDRKKIMNYELSLLYTQTDFSRFTSYYDELQSVHMDDEAVALLEKNKRRFVGNPSQTSFYAHAAEKEGNMQRARSIYEEDIALQPNSWAAYSGLSSLLIRQGDFKTASETALKYPLFSVPPDRRDQPGIDTVALSNYAVHIGRDLWWTGAAEEARPLLRLSASYDTGSGAEMWSTAMLALLDHDFGKAAQMSLTEARRYDSRDAYSEYMKLLHMMGYHDEAWSAFTQIQQLSHGGMDWSPVLLGLRMEGKTTDEQLQWLKKQPVAALTPQDAVDFSFFAYTVDRKPEINLSKKLHSIREQIEESKTGSKAPAPPKFQPRPQIAGAPSEEFIKKRFADPLETLSDGYALLKERQFSDAYEKLKGRFLGDWIKEGMFSFAIPYLAWSAVKSGKAPEIESYLADYRKELGDDFDYYLSQAFLSAGRKDHQGAIRNLESARYHGSIFNGKRLFSVWYQLTESCEWLYEDSKYEGYRELLLKFARLRQTIRPMDSWAYSFEAKYTKSESDRIRALAITLYLDKQSERIAHFSTKQKNQALEWLKENNPFLLNQKGATQRDI